MIFVMYPYMTLNDGTEITHSALIGQGETQSVEVCFQRPKADGAEHALCVLPGYSWKLRNGFTDEEICYFEKLLQNNAHLFFKFAKSGGIFGSI